MEYVVTKSTGLCQAVNNVNNVKVETFDPAQFSDPEYLDNNEFYSPVSIVDETYMCFLNNIVIVDDIANKNQSLSFEGRFKHNQIPLNLLPCPHQKSITTLQLSRHNLT